MKEDLSNKFHVRLLYREKVCNGAKNHLVWSPDVSGLDIAHADTEALFAHLVDIVRKLVVLNCNINVADTTFDAQELMRHGSYTLAFRITCLGPVFPSVPFDVGRFVKMPSGIYRFQFQEPVRAAAENAA